MRSKNIKPIAKKEKSAKRGRPAKSENIKLIARSEAFNLGYNLYCAGKTMQNFTYPISHSLGKAERAGFEAAKVEDKKTKPM